MEDPGRSTGWQRGCCLLHPQQQPSCVWCLSFQTFTSLVPDGYLIACETRFLCSYVLLMGSYSEMDHKEAARMRRWLGGSSTVPTSLRTCVWIPRTVAYKNHINTSLRSHKSTLMEKWEAEAGKPPEAPGLIGLL